MLKNPWFQGHVTAEAKYQNGDRLLAKQIVAEEYRWAPEPVPCACGSQAYYKATIGAMKCPDCSALYHTDGERI